MMMQMKKLLISTNAYFVFAFVATSWLTLVYLNYNFLTSSKFRHLDKSLRHYSDESKNRDASALKARGDLREWLSKQSSQLHQQHLFVQTNQTKHLCFAIVSKNRIGSNVNYVNQVVMAFITRTPRNVWHSLSAFAFNVEDKPNDNKNLLELADLIQIVNITNTIKHDSNARVKEAIDYSIVLETLYKFDCNYSILIEDDALVAYNWYDSIVKALNNIETNYKNVNWSCIKLFSGYKFYDWDWLHNFQSIVVTIVISVMVFTFKLILLGSIKIFTKQNDNLTLKTLWASIKQTSIILLFILLLNSFALVVWFKATSIKPINSSSNLRVYWTGFGMVSILVPKYNLIPLAHYLNKTANDYLTGKSNFFKAKDLLLDYFRDENKLVEFVIEPSLFQHTGIHSSLYDRDRSEMGFKKMFKSFSFIDNHKLIVFNPYS